MIAVGGLVWPATAFATNGFRPRTTPTFELEQCLTVVDRDSPNLHVDFSIPFEDAELTADELSDSRTLQFFALCRDQHPELDALPNWVAQDDVDRSLMAEIIEDAPADADVLDLSNDWADCAWRLNPDDARIPITCQATDGALDFDTSSLEPGSYVVRGYTFEPALNVWVARRGVVQVRDGDAAMPVAALMSPPRDDWTAYEEDGFDIVGCMAGPEGTTVRVQWASLIALDWHLLEVVDTPDFEIHFDFPPEAVNQPVIFRAIAEAPGGETWTGYAPGTLLVLPGDGDTNDPDPPPGIDYCDHYPDPDPDPDPDTTSSGGEDESSAAGSDTTATTTGIPGATETDAPSAAANPSGCGCRTTTGPPVLLLLLLGAARRRRNAGNCAGTDGP